MNVSPNKELDTLLRNLSTNSENRYIHFDSKKKKIWLSNQKPQNSNIFLIFNLIKEKIHLLTEQHPCLTLQEYKDRISILQKIDEQTTVIRDQYLEHLKAPQNKLFSMLHEDHSTIIQSRKRKTEAYYAIFKTALEKVLHETKTYQDITVERKNEISSSSSLPDAPINIILHYCALAFEKAIADPNWKDEHKELLCDLYDRIYDDLLDTEDGELTIDDIGGIASTSEQLTDVLGEESVWSKFIEKETGRVCRLNQLKLAANLYLLDDILKGFPYDEETNFFVMEKEKFRLMTIICEHIETGKVDGLHLFSTEQIIKLFSFHYFQEEPEFLNKCFIILNRKNRNIKLKNHGDGIRLTLFRSTSEGSKVLMDPYISQNITELSLECFGATQHAKVNNPDKLLIFLLERLPNLQKVMLPFPTVITKAGIDKMKEVKTLKEVHLDLSECKSSDYFHQTAAELSQSFNHEGWHISLEHTMHLTTKDAMQILPFFPRSRSVCFNDKKDFGNDHLTYLCEKLKDIHSLSLQRCHLLTDEGIVAVGKHAEKLRKIWLFGCSQVTDAGVVALLEARGSNLMHLDLGLCNITNKTAMHIGTACRKLQALGLWECTHVHEDGIAHIIEKCQKLRSLDLNSCAISNSTVEKIATKLPEIKILSLRGCKAISSDSVRHLLSCCSNLSLLDIRGTEISSEEMLELQVAYPNVKFL